MEFPADIVQLDVRYAVKANSASEAKTLMEKKLTSLIQAARKHGVKDSDLAAGSASISPVISYDTATQKSVVSGVTVTRALQITIRELDAYSELAQAAYDAEPVSMSVGLSGTPTDRIEEAQRAAVADARRRASVLADALGRRLAGVYSLSEFDLRETERYSLYPSIDVSPSSNVAGHVSVAGVGGYDAPSGEVFLPGLITAKATVYVVFLLEE